ncbi:MAG: murein biosynthesis integral membrane protein MurJ, partial [Spirochaetaceae bacterium]|nr:murein biosynthesis integral membrane protein MurJ [Spirochaetaceae bacterium]
MPTPRTLLRAGAALSVLTLSSRVLGLLREMTKAALLGTGALSDAFTVAFMLPNLFRRLFAEGSVAVAFIPTLKEHHVAGNASETQEFLNSFWTIVAFAASVAVCLGILSSPILIPLFKLQNIDEGILLTRIMFPYLLFISVAAFFQGILNSEGSFVPSALAPIALNIAVIGAAWLLSPHMENPARALAAGVFIGGLLEAAIQLPIILKKGVRLAFRPLARALKNPGARKAGRLIAPTILGMAAYQVNDLVSTALASRAGVGIVSSLQYSLRLQELILGVFAVTIGTILLPTLSEDASRRNWDAYTRNLIHGANIIALLTIPATVYALIQGETVVRLLFQTRSFDEHSVALTTSVFRCHIVGLYFIALNRILAPAFYARSNTATPTVAGIASIAVNIALAIVLTPIMQGRGIALALSIASAVNTAILIASLRRAAHIPIGPHLRRAGRRTAVVAAAALAAAIPTAILSPTIAASAARLGPHNRLIAHAAPLIATLAIYAASAAVILAVMRDPYIRAIGRA